jgi:uncharacterized repeat protein (TIGR01451 family)
MQASKVHLTKVRTLCFAALLLFLLSAFRLPVRAAEAVFTLTSTPAGGTQAAPKAVRTGNKITYCVLFQNRDKENTLGTQTAYFEIPAGLSLDDTGLSWYTNGMKKKEAKPLSDPASPVSCSLSGQNVSVTVPSVSPGQSIRVLIPVRVQAERMARTYAAKAVQTAGDGAVRETETLFHSCAGADSPLPTLSVTTSPKAGTADAPSAVKAGKTITYHLTVKNPGKYFAAEDTLLQFPVPEGLTLDPSAITFSEGATAETSFDGQVLTLRVPTLAPKQKVKISVPMTAAPCREGKTYAGMMTLVSSSGTAIGSQVQTFHAQSPAGVPKVSFDITTTASRGTAKSPKKVVSGSCIHYIISLKNKDKNFAIGTALVTDVIPQGLTLDPSRITYYRNDAATAAVPVSAGDGSVQAAFDGSTLTLSLSGIPAGEKLSVVVPCEVTPQEAEELFINTPVLVSIDGAQVNTQASKPCYQVKSAGK